MRSTTHLRQAAVAMFGAAALFGVTLLSACNSNGTSDVNVGAPAIVKVAGGSDINAEVATDAGPYVFLVTDTAGNGVPGIPVTFTISGPAALITTSATTDNSGSVLTSIHFGNTAGNVTITATANGIATPAVLHTSSYAGAIAKLVAVGGNGQSALHGTMLGDQLSVLVTDRFDNPVSSVLVTFNAGAGTLGTPSARTGADGRLSTTYTLPAVVGDQTVTAFITINNTNLTVDFTAHAT